MRKSKNDNYGPYYEGPDGKLTRDWLGPEYPDLGPAVAKLLALQREELMRAILTQQRNALLSWPTAR